MMSERTSLSTLSHATTRRQMIAGVAVAFGSLAGGHIWGKTQQQAMKEMPSTAANAKRTSLHLEFEYNLDSRQFATFSGMPAEIDPKEGGAFSMFGGMIVGRNVELVPNQRVVQAWRPTHVDPGGSSILRFELKPRDPETMLVLDHTGFPEGEFDHLEWGWNNHYGEPLKKFLV